MSRCKNKAHEERLAKMRQGGTNAHIEEQHKKGKLSARERLDVLCDPGTFEETGAFVHHRARDFGMDHRQVPGDGVITGWGQVDGRRIALFAQDFTVFGGSLGEAHAHKICRMMDMAVAAGVPMVGLNDSGGARIQEGVDALGGYAEVFYRTVQASGVIPQLSLIMGPCAGGAVYAPAMTDFIFMVHDTSYMYVTGPDVVKTVTHEEVSHASLGGAEVHAKISGVADHAFDTDVDALLALKRLLSFLPDSNRVSPPQREYDFPIEEDASLDSLVPRNPLQSYDMRELVLKCLDDEDFYEIKPDYARNILIGFGRIAGQVVGVIANQPMVLAGCLDINASRKAARFVRFCDCFGIPLVTFVDVPGFLPGLQQEHNGIIPNGAKLLFAYAEASVPRLTVITRKAYGGAYDVMNSKHIRGDLNFAWPTAEIAVMGPRGAVQILHKRAQLSADEIQIKTDEYTDLFANPYVAAARGYLDDVILPRQTRQRLAEGLRLLKGKTLVRVAKKHDNIPL